MSGADRDPAAAATGGSSGRPATFGRAATRLERQKESPTNQGRALTGLLTATSANLAEDIAEGTAY